MQTATQHETEKYLLQCLMALYERSDPLQTKDGVGLNRQHKNSDFVRSMLQYYASEHPLTVNQFRALANILIVYKKQLNDIGLPFPDQQTIQTIITEKEKQAPSDKTCIDILLHEDQYGEREKIFVHAAWKERELQEKLKEKARDFNIRFFWYPVVNKSWGFIPTSPEQKRKFFSALIQIFPPNKYEYTENAIAYYQQLQEEIIAEQLEILKENEETKKKFEELCNALGGLTGEVAPGIHLFQHQIEAVEMVLKRKNYRAYIADDTGVGKTFEGIVAAKALQRYYGWKIFIVTTKSAIPMWKTTLQQFQVEAYITNWEQISRIVAHEIQAKEQNTTTELFQTPFIIIGDEAQKITNIKSQRTKNFLFLTEHPQCKSVILMSGTPMTNRPFNLYPALLALQHPLVWSRYETEKKQKKTLYIRQFCAPSYITMNGRSIMQPDGASNLNILNMHLQYSPGNPKNHKDACMIARLKENCRDMPPKMRIMQPVELSDTALALFKKSVQEMWKQFNRNIEAKVSEMNALIDAEIQKNPDMSAYYDTIIANGQITRRKLKLEEVREKALQAEAIVGYNFFRHSGARAKIETVLNMAEEILANGHKLVIYTTFTDVAMTIGEVIETQFHTRVGYILGETKAEERQKNVDEFQDPLSSLRVIINSAAGSEAITLNAATYMLIVDRPWTPGAVRQQEDRIWRINNNNSVTIYWLQLPEDITSIDLKIDAILQEKQINIDKVQYGKESSGLEFAQETDLNKQAFSLLSQAVQEILKA